MWSVLGNITVSRVRLNLHSRDIEATETFTTSAELRQLLSVVRPGRLGLMRATKRSWTEEDSTRLVELVRSGVSAARCAVIFKRRITSVQKEARRRGCAFPDIRAVKKARIARGVEEENRLRQT